MSKVGAYIGVAEVRSDLAQSAGIRRGMVLIAVRGVPPLKRFLRPDGADDRRGRWTGGNGEKARF